ncbi:MAG: IPT/TIG domain-containing protein, partial [Terriglobales bacterium]
VGKPITWANASLTYYTDLGDLSPALPQTTANAFVADAFARWTAVSGAALTATRGGGLAQDVSGSNFFFSGDTLMMPADIQPSATHRTLGVIYDHDGQVTDALLGAGASGSLFCATNSVVGGADSYTPDAHFAHALIVINGNYAQQAADLPMLKFRVMRMAGRILGVGWSQLNDNVRTLNPSPTTEDLAGFPLMHPKGPVCSGSLATCLSNPEQLRMDDRAAIAYLYPAAVTTTARIRGIIYFSDERGLAGQPMQGVNVVARRLDPVSGVASRVYGAASVSGFRFRGKHGNPITGFQTAQGEPLAKFGSADLALEGYYDLSGLEIPEGATSVSYQLSLEPLNPLYVGESGVGPYRYGVVAPSGSTAPIVVVNLAAGTDVTRDIIIPNSARVGRDAAEPNPFPSPSPVPAGGVWWSSLSGHGDFDFYSFPARAGRTFQFRVTALNESYVSTTAKARPVLGVWESGAPADSPPAVKVSPFNTVILGQTRIGVVIAAEAGLVLGIADERGDGRPDFQYHARLLYADTLAPERIPAGGGGPVMLEGYGFNANTNVTIGGQPAVVLARTASRLLLQPPSLGNGTVPVVVADLATGDTSTITAGARYGVTGGDLLELLAAANPAVPVGAETLNPIRVRVTAADGTSPIANANVTFSVSPVQSFFPACGTNPCALLTDARGEAIVTLAVRAASSNVVTAAIANGAQVVATIVGASATSSLYASVPFRRVPNGATRPVVISVRALSSGSPVVGQAVNFTLGTTPSAGSASLAAASVVTNSAGDAINTVNVAALGSSFTVLACFAAGSPCTTIGIQAVAESALHLHGLRGGAQILTSGQSAAPVLLRVTDAGQPDRPVQGVSVSVSSTVFARLRGADCDLQNTDCRVANARPLATAFTTLVTDDNGLVTFTPATQSAWGAANIYTLFRLNAAPGQSHQAVIQIFK